MSGRRIADLLNPMEYRAWGLLPLGVLIWHSNYTINYLSPDYLLFICYWSTLSLSLGVLFRNATLIGVGFGWLIIAVPLWFYDSVINSYWEISCTLFHLVGPAVGLMAARRYRMPKHTWSLGVLMAVVLWVLARMFTDEALNINASFRVYDGWEGVFSDYKTYMATMVVGFGLILMAITHLSNRFLLRQEAE